MSFAEFFTTLKEGRFGFGVIKDAVVNLYYSITENPDIVPIWNWIMNLIEPIFGVVTVVLLAVALIGVFFGKKALPFYKFVFFFIVGFALGVHLLAPIIPDVVTIPSWVVGIVLAVVVAVLYKFLYYALYALCFGYSAYILAYYGCFFIKEPVYTPTRAAICVIIAVAVICLAFVLRKYIEMLGTAALGAFMTTKIFISFVYDFTEFPFLAGIEWVGILVVSIILGLLGFIVQFKTRRRY